MHTIIIQNPYNMRIPISIKILKKIINKVLELDNKKHELVIRIVDLNEIINLNIQYRDNNNPTNIISFQCELPQGVHEPYLGDIVICMPVVIQEAKMQSKSIEAHFSHLLVHGVLHLLGYTHKNIKNAAIMEQKEIEYLELFNFNNPYHITP